MTGPHLSSSDLRSAVNSTGVELAAIVPMSANRCLVGGCAIAATASMYTFPTISAGVLGGKKSAYQEDTSNPGTPDSAILGMSGRNGDRMAEVTASARIAPLSIKARADGVVANITSTRPGIRSLIAGPPPRYWPWV